MSYKSMLLALLFVSLSGCAVYGGGSGYGHRSYDRHYSTSYYQVQRYPVYVVPQQRYPAYRHDGRRHEDYRQPPRYYVPAPPPRHYQPHTYQRRHDYRAVQPRAGWDNRPREYFRERPQHRQERYDGRRHGGEQRRDERRGWERQRN